MQMEKSIHVKISIRVKKMQMKNVAVKSISTEIK